MSAVHQNMTQEPSMLARALQRLTFTIPGKLTGANRVKTTIRMGAHNRTITTASGRQDLSRVYQLAWAAAQQIRWIQPEACAVSIVAWNSRLDCDATPKIILDGMIGAVYPDDKIVTALEVSKRCDRDGERYEVTVAPCLRLEKPKPLRAMRWQDVRVRDYPRLALSAEESFLEAPGCKPMSTVDVPHAWRERARKALESAK